MMTTGSVGFVLALVLFGPAGQPTQQAAKLVTQMGQTGQVQVWVVDALDNVLRTDTPPQNRAQEIVLEAASLSLACEQRPRRWKGQRAPKLKPRSSAVGSSDMYTLKRTRPILPMKNW